MWIKFKLSYLWCGLKPEPSNSGTWHQWSGTKVINTWLKAINARKMEKGAVRKNKRIWYGPNSPTQSKISSNSMGNNCSSLVAGGRSFKQSASSSDSLLGSFRICKLKCDWFSTVCFIFNSLACLLARLIETVKTDGTIKHTLLRGTLITNYFPFSSSSQSQLKQHRFFAIWIGHKVNQSTIMIQVIDRPILGSPWMTSR